MEVVTAIFLVCAAVFFHELSHSWAAVAFGVKVKRVYIGYPALLTLETKIGSVPVIFSPLIFAVGIELDNKDLWALPLKRKVLVYACGGLGNIIIALFVATAILGVHVGPRVTLEMLIASVEAILKLFTFQVSWADISGPVGIVLYSTYSIKAQFGLGSLFSWLMINSGLAAFNLLPVPALDGGHILLSAKLKNHPEGRKEWERLTLKFVKPLIGLMLLLSVNDILKAIN